MKLFLFIAVSVILCEAQFDANSSDDVEHEEVDLLLSKDRHVHSRSKSERVCTGTNIGFSHSVNSDRHTKNLRQRYEGCAYVDGNLELTHIGPDEDLSFLNDIREVSGYLLIAFLNTTRIELPNLRIIRGRNVFQFDQTQFGLLIANNDITTDIDIHRLRAVLVGNIGIYRNERACNLDRVNWDDLIDLPDYHQVFTDFSSTPRRKEWCPRGGECHYQCAGRCWGPNWTQCQVESKTCPPQCGERRCFGKDQNVANRQCCHESCAGGCDGKTNRNCTACLFFDDDGTCSQECPPLRIYDQSTFQLNKNPNGKYAYGGKCVRDCPAHLLKDDGACVRKCPANKRENENFECVKCDQDPCPKKCTGNDDSLEYRRFIHSANIKSFVNCTRIEGNLVILQSTFDGYTFFTNEAGEPLAPNKLKHVPPLTPQDLQILSSVKEITGFVNIEGSHEALNSLDFLRNLRNILGRTQWRNRYSLRIEHSGHLEQLRLDSLRRINGGGVLIRSNEKLCYAQTINWKKLLEPSTASVSVARNAKDVNCHNRREICSLQCSLDGCWGPGVHHCLSCQNMKFGSECVQTCDLSRGMYFESSNTCAACHEECKEGCSGPGPANCTTCANAKDGPYCVKECPNMKFVDDFGICQPCSDKCYKGCSGPGQDAGKGGCNICNVAIENATVDSGYSCLENGAVCPKGYFDLPWQSSRRLSGLRPDSVLSPIRDRSSLPLGRRACEKCHDLCLECDFYGQDCTSCRFYEQDGMCVRACYNNFYPTKLSHTDELGSKHPDAGKCMKCHDECIGCTGPTSMECQRCKNYQVHVNEDGFEFNCTKACPAEYPYKITYDDNVTPTCVSATHPEAVKRKLAKKTSVIVIVSIIAVVVLITLVIAAIVITGHRKKTATAKQKSLEYAAQIVGPVTEEPVHETAERPNMADLRIIKETNLKKQKILGAGAFGTVYKGIWTPEGEKGVRLDVAIKVLSDSEGKVSAISQREFLDEASLMASVKHPSLVPLIAVCLASTPFLITPLMKFGCLLSYVKQNKESIGSKMMLNWLLQIAKGMKYLEKRRLVHRDLAARNVLLSSPSVCKITDFGLAKMLDVGEKEFKAGSGKMPIKWMPLESITRGIFNSKSDVWAFGVTAWEVFTYGAKPYELIPNKEMAKFLEKGGRLKKPEICTLDVFVVLVKCWMEDPESRYSFSEIVRDLTPMCRDPGRFLVIHGDRFLRAPSNPASIPPTTPNDLQEGDEDGVGNGEKLRYRSLSTLAREKRAHNNHQPLRYTDSTPGVANDPYRQVLSYTQIMPPDNAQKQNQHALPDYPVLPRSNVTPSPNLMLDEQNYLLPNSNKNSNATPHFYPYMDHPQYLKVYNGNYQDYQHQPQYSTQAHPPLNIIPNPITNISAPYLADRDAPALPSPEASTSSSNVSPVNSPYRQVSTFKPQDAASSSSGPQKYSWDFTDNPAYRNAAYYHDEHGNLPDDRIPLTPTQKPNSFEDYPTFFATKFANSKTENKLDRASSNGGRRGAETSV